MLKSFHIFLSVKQKQKSMDFLNIRLKFGDRIL